MRYLRGVTPLSLAMVRFLGFPSSMTLGTGLPHPELCWEVASPVVPIARERRRAGGERRDFIAREILMVRERLNADGMLEA